MNTAHEGVAAPPPSPLDLALVVPGDLDLAELVAAWPKLDARQRRQFVALVRSMVRAPANGPAYRASRAEPAARG